MDSLTEVKTQKGEEIKLGDILSSPMTHDVIVRLDPKRGLVAEIIDRPDYVFDLKTFVSKWSDLHVTGNMMDKEKKIYVGKVVEREIDYGNSNEMYHDVSLSGLNEYLTQELYVYEGKRVRVTVEVIE
ncbi:hypothetical protein ACQUY5_30715 [Bacillus cereus]|uniref:hypothetical protein n=1 Tax=Bacillus cereus TaxID=1396 RepID=UPI003D17B84E